jgi:hypothetical protein
LFKQSTTKFPNLTIQNLFTLKEMDPNNKWVKESKGMKRGVYLRVLTNKGSEIMKIKSIPCLAKELPLTSSSWSLLQTLEGDKAWQWRSLETHNVLYLTPIDTSNTFLPYVMHIIIFTLFMFLDELHFQFTYPLRNVA